MNCLRRFWLARRTFCPVQRLEVAPAFPPSGFTAIRVAVLLPDSLAPSCSEIFSPSWGRRPGGCAASVWPPSARPSAGEYGRCLSQRHLPRLPEPVRRVRELSAKSGRSVLPKRGSDLAGCGNDQFQGVNGPLAVLGGTYPEGTAHITHTCGRIECCIISSFFAAKRSPKWYHSAKIALSFANTMR